MPSDLIGPYYLFVITDPPTDSAIGKVFEGGGANEDNNSLFLAPPLVIDPPPPSNLAVTSITLPSPPTVKSGDPFTVSWMVQDTSADQPRAGELVGRGLPRHRDHLGHLRRLPGHGAAPGHAPARRRATPARSTTNLPSVTPGPYHIIVRTDIFNQIHAAGGGAGLEQDDGLGRPADRRRGQPDAGRPLRHDALAPARSGCCRSPCRRGRRCA